MKTGIFTGMLYVDADDLVTKHVNTTGDKYDDLFLIVCTSYIAEFFFWFIKMYFIPMQQTKDLSQETFTKWQEATCGLNLEYFGASASDKSSHLWELDMQ